MPKVQGKKESLSLDGSLPISEFGKDPKKEGRLGIGSPVPTSDLRS